MIFLEWAVWLVWRRIDLGGKRLEGNCSEWEKDIMANYYFQGG